MAGAKGPAPGAANSKGNKQQDGKPSGGWSLFGAKKKVVVAKLGNESNMYFHPELKCWVERGKEHLAVAQAAPPPPPKAASTNSLVDQQQGTAPSSNAATKGTTTPASTMSRPASKYALQDGLQVSQSGSDATSRASSLMPGFPRPAMGAGTPPKTFFVPGATPAGGSAFNAYTAASGDQQQAPQSDAAPYGYGSNGGPAAPSTLSPIASGVAGDSQLASAAAEEEQLQQLQGKQELAVQPPPGLASLHGDTHLSPLASPTQHTKGSSWPPAPAATAQDATHHEPKHHYQQQQADNGQHAPPALQQQQPPSHYAGSNAVLQSNPQQGAPPTIGYPLHPHHDQAAASGGAPPHLSSAAAPPAANGWGPNNHTQQPQQQRTHASAAAPPQADTGVAESAGPRVKGTTKLLGAVAATLASTVAVTSRSMVAHSSGPEALDEFERIMHPGAAHKLDGPLPWELPDPLKHSDQFISICSNWQKNNPGMQYSRTLLLASVTGSAPDAAAADATPSIPMSPLRQQQQHQEQQPVVSLTGTTPREEAAPAWAALQLQPRPDQRALAPVDAPGAEEEGAVQAPGARTQRYAVPDNLAVEAEDAAVPASAPAAAQEEASADPEGWALGLDGLISLGGAEGGEVQPTTSHGQQQPVGEEGPVTFFPSEQEGVEAPPAAADPEGAPTSMAQQDFGGDMVDAEGGAAAVSGLEGGEGGDAVPSVIISEGGQQQQQQGGEGDGFLAAMLSYGYTADQVAYYTSDAWQQWYQSLCDQYYMVQERLAQEPDYSNSDEYVGWYEQYSVAMQHQQALQAAAAAGPSASAAVEVQQPLGQQVEEGAVGLVVPLAVEEGDREEAGLPVDAEGGVVGGDVTAAADQAEHVPVMLPGGGEEEEQQQGAWAAPVPAEEEEEGKQHPQAAEPRSVELPVEEAPGAVDVSSGPVLVASVVTTVTVAVSGGGDATEHQVLGALLDPEATQLSGGDEPLGGPSDDVADHLASEALQQGLSELLAHEHEGAQAQVQQALDAAGQVQHEGTAAAAAALADAGFDLQQAPAEPPAPEVQQQQPQPPEQSPQQLVEAVSCVHLVVRSLRDGQPAPAPTLARALSFMQHLAQDPHMVVAAAHAALATHDHALPPATPAGKAHGANDASAASQLHTPARHSVPSAPPLSDPSPTSEASPPQHQSRTAEEVEEEVQARVQAQHAQLEGELQAAFGRRRAELEHDYQARSAELEEAYQARVKELEQGYEARVGAATEELRRQYEQQVADLTAQVAEHRAACEATQAELDELLLCLGQESTKVGALTEAMLAAGLDPGAVVDPIEAEYAAMSAGAAAAAEEEEEPAAGDQDESLC